MVKFRGIEINVISQFDICKLPEFHDSFTPQARQHDPFTDSTHHKLPSPTYSVATCAIPIYPGSQIWFEYTIDGPHPPKAAYFFKLFINEVLVTSWDCTAKHGFHGKMMYNLVCEGQKIFQRQALRFGDSGEEGDRQDVVQINVYRIEKRARMRNVEFGLGNVDLSASRADGLRLTNSGLLEHGLHPRRYKYKLLDPLDVPYAAFQFHCRSCDFLEARSIEPLHERTSPVSSRSSMVSQSSGNVKTFSDTGVYNDLSPEAGSIRSWPKETTMISPAKVMPGTIPCQDEQANTLRASDSLKRMIPSNSEDSLSVKTKDSIEDLPSNVTRSPRSPMSPRAGKLRKPSDIPPSPTRSPKSPRRRLIKKLTVNIDGTNFEIEKEKQPLSPFTSSGVLRKESSSQTAATTIVDFTANKEETSRIKLQKEKSEVDSKAMSTTGEERGGRRLMSLLGRRITGDRGFF